jgi:hypothetical protein
VSTKLLCFSHTNEHKWKKKKFESISWPYLWVLLSLVTPYFNLKPCYMQNEKKLLN